MNNTSSVFPDQVKLPYDWRARSDVEAAARAPAAQGATKPAALEPKDKSLPAVSPDRHVNLDDAPPLPPEALQHLATTNEQTLERFDVLLLESQSAWQRGLAATPTDRLIQSLGGVENLHSEQMMAAYLLLCATGTNGTRQALQAMQAAQEDHIDASLKRQGRAREQIEADVARLERMTSQLAPVMTAIKAVSVVATAALLCTSAPAGLALAGVGAALGAGGALALQGEQVAGDWGQAGSVAAHGALWGASLAGVFGAPLVAWLAGSSPWMALGVGAKYAAEREALIGWEFAANLTRLGTELGMATGQVALDWRALAVRNSQGQLRVQQVDATLATQGRQASLDSLTQLVSRRHAALNQAQQVLSKRHQAVVRIQAQMRH